MRRTGVVVIAVLVLAGNAAASTAPVQWSKTDMVAAVKALGYPKPHTKTVTCRKAGAGYNCKATYRRVRRFYIQGVAQGGFLCAGSRPSTCKVLRHGFVPNHIAQNQPKGVALLASRGYMAVHYNDPQPFAGSGDCAQPAGPSSWSFCYALDNGNVNVTVAVRKAKGGYVTTSSGTTY